MKKGIHPNYHPVEIVMTDGTSFQTRSCFKSNRMVLEIDSKSHPFNKRFEKTQRLKDTTAKATEVSAVSEVSEAPVQA
jgi:large subunit ribosomal protein L31